ncbi:MAG: hypothetical protein KAH32_06875 [Chlamydiia bacterium]|nr:hypothetical protein [Chlamydiia bacterium]
MPKNQQNLANADYLKYMQKIVDLPKNKTQFDTLDKIKSIDNLALNPKDIAEN